jgi:hypothetical protein
MNYNCEATDQYMLSVLVDEFSVDEADNALTALSTLTNAYPSLFPHERTFARPDHQPGVKGPAGVRFVVFGESGIVRFIQLPREALASLKAAIDNLFAVVSGLVKTATI